MGPRRTWRQNIIKETGLTTPVEHRHRLGQPVIMSFDASEALVSVWRTSAAVVGVRQLGIAASVGPARPPDRGSEDSERGSVVDALA